jgi:hypothetical protein
VARGPSPPPTRPRAPHQIREGHTEGVGDEQQVVDERRVRSLFDPVDGLAVEARHFPESFLCEFLAYPFGPDLVSDGVTALQDSGGRGLGWHAYTLVGPLIVVCTIVGTFAGGPTMLPATACRLKHSFE